MNRFHLISCRFHLYNKNRLLVQGWFDEDEAGDSVIRIYLDKKLLPSKMEVLTEVAAVLHPGINTDAMAHYYNYWVKVPDGALGRLVIYRDNPSGRHKIAEIIPKSMKEMRGQLNYSIDGGELLENGFQLSGWRASGKPVRIRVWDNATRKRIPVSISYHGRSDLIRRYPEAKEGDMTGFTLTGKGVTPKSVKVFFETEDAEGHLDWVLKKSAFRQKKEKLSELAFKAKVYRQQFGTINTIKRFADKLARKEGIDYNTWRMKTLPSRETLEKQKQYPFKKRNVFSLITVVEEPDVLKNRPLFKTLKAQTYGGWELIMIRTEESSGNGKFSSFRGNERPDRRIHIVTAPRGASRADILARAVKRTGGDYIALIDPDSAFSPETFYRFAEEADRNPEADIIYSDEDKLNIPGRKYSDPVFKPDYDMDLQRSENYIGDLFAARKEISAEAARESSEESGLWNFDYILRCCEKARAVSHAPIALYHKVLYKNQVEESDPETVRGKDTEALRRHFARIGINADTEVTEIAGVYRNRYRYDDTPLVSIIIPNKDHTEDLDKCLSSIESLSKYPAIEYVIVENNSEKPETFSYYETLKNRNKRVRVITWENEFNYSAINNFGARNASGQYFLFMNNDIEMIAPDCIEEMLGYASRKDVGAVGAKLLYADGSIQHAGVILGLGGVAGHAFNKEPGDVAGYERRAVCAQRYSAVTAACMMVRKDVFEEVEGFSSDFSVAYNDIDFCLRLRGKGLHIIYTPYALLYHYESKSRGSEGTPEKSRRFLEEVELFMERWKPVLSKRDPYYNPNLTIHSSDFDLKTEVDL